MNSFLKPLVILAITLTTSFSFGQNYKTELRTIDSSATLIKTQLFITQISKSEFDVLIRKVNNTNLYTVKEEFFPEKNFASIYLESINKTSLHDFELFLKQLEIYSVIYNNQTISSQEISDNYKQYKKNEIIKAGRLK